MAPMGQSAIIYIRVSSDRQVENASLETQERACRAYCEKNGWDVLRVFREEGESAKTADRPQLIEALAFCRKNKIRPRYFVVYSVDRLARNTYDHTHIRKSLLAYGVLLRSPTQQLGESPLEKLMENMLAGYAEFDNDVRAEKTVAGMKTRISQGQWPWRAAIGYLNARDKRGAKTLVHDPERSPLVKKAFDLYASGLHTKQHVLDTVTSLGLRTRKGRKLSPEDLRRMLHNPAYAGMLSVEKWGVEATANFSPIVDRNTFDSVQRLLSGKQTGATPKARNHPDFPLRHFVRCGNCGKPLTASWSKNHAKNKYGYYRCQNRGNCPSQVNEPKQRVEAAFLEYLGRLQPKLEYVQLFRKIVLKVWEDKKSDAAVNYAALDREVKAPQGTEEEAFRSVFRWGD